MNRINVYDPTCKIAVSGGYTSTECTSFTMENTITINVERVSRLIDILD